MSVPAELALLLETWPRPDQDEQAFPFVTVDEDGYPHVMLLCTAELLATNDRAAILVAVASANARANLARNGVATLIAADGAAAHYAKLRVRDSEEHGHFTVYTCQLANYKRDSLGIPLRPMDFHATQQVAENERWAATRAALTERVKEIG
jgi:predicted pyridoxine 5'-phosphate oxidase superfamily flavin-nucleotide-binding protein